MSNPYNKINPRDFALNVIARHNGRVIIVINQADHSGFDMCVFRRYLFDTLMEELQGGFSLRNSGNDYRLELNEGWDEEVVSRHFTLVN